MTQNSPENPKGRILRIKRGYNPNSSSVGSDIPAFLYSGAALTILGAITVQIHNLLKKTFRPNSPTSELSKKPGHGQ